MSPAARTPRAGEARRACLAGGSSRSSASFTSRSMASMRKPSTPRRARSARRPAWPRPRGVAPVEVGLLGVEGVQVPAAAAVVAGPRGPSEGGQPVVGGPVPTAVGPHVAIRVFGEPRMLDRGVAGHQVHQQPQAVVVGRCDQAVEVLEVAVDGVDRGVVGDVVAEVRHRRRVDGRQPEASAPSAAIWLQPPLDAGQVAHAVAVGVLEGAGVDLVHHRVAPPLRAVIVPHMAETAPKGKVFGTKRSGRAGGAKRPFGAPGRGTDAHGRR